MTQDDFFKLFAETGEPMCWLLSRAAAQSEVPAHKREAPMPEMSAQELPLQTAE